MASIGFVNGTIEKGFVGQLKTLSIRAAIEIRTNRSKNGDVQPDYRVYSEGVEIGAGFAAAELSGEDNADQMRLDLNKQPVFLSNHAGGVLGGISTGQPVTARVAFKPTSSILTPRQTITRDGEETDLRTKGRHDPCVALRAVPVVEAMAACVLADALLRHRAQVG